MKTIQVGAFEAKNRLSELLAQAERGQRILITRRGTGVAMLCAPDALEQVNRARQDPRAVLTRLRAIRSHAKTGPESLKALVEKGRR
jgi:antitoxin (DNA-binding transcriptional repressor) of toxin-antitoxin stability system